MKDGTQFLRGLGCVVLIALLALSGYMGTAQQNTQAATVSAPIVFETLEEASVSLAGEDAQSRLADEREKALRLLEDIICDSRTPESAIKEAMKRKTEMAVYMETEARIVKTLEAMGFQGITALCGGRMTTVIVPEKLVLDEKARVQIVDAAANAANQSADCVKIIPQKNE